MAGGSLTYSTFTQTGGSATFNTGFRADNAAYSLSAGSLTQTNIDGYVGFTGTATFTHTGGSHIVGAPGTVARHLYLANNAGSSASYSLSGTGALTVHGDEFVGYNGPASFRQTAGSHSVTGTLHLGASAGATGTYSLSGTGRLSAATQTLGASGTGSFTHTGGTHSVTSTLTLGRSPGARGVYSLSTAGTLTATTLYVGDAATGTFTHTGGRAVLAGDLVLARTSTSTGHYSLSGGASLLSRGSQTVGAAGRATFTQTGGTNLILNPAATITTPITADLLIADNSSSTATYSLSGGFLTIGTSPAAPGQSAREYLGRTGGRATFTQTGGAHTVANDLYVGSPNPGITSTASFSLAGGSLSVGSIHVTGPASTFTWSAGSLSFTNSPFTDGPFSISDAARLTLTPGANKVLPRYPSIDSHPNSRLDLNDNLLSTPETLAIDAVRTDLATGHLLSTTAANDPQQRLALAYWLSPNHPTAFRGFPIGANTLNVAQAYLGDANVDGRVGPDDFALLDRSFAMHLAGAYWSDGDFDYDGLVTSADYLLADQAFLTQPGAPISTLVSKRQSQFGSGYVAQLLTSIPEPTLNFPSLLAGLILRRAPRKISLGASPSRDILIR